MITFLAKGTVLGLSAGFAPGPLLALVIAETIRHDMKAGVKVALAPILTDFPIIVLTLFILEKLSSFHFVLGIISLSGGLFVLHMGYQSLRTSGVNLKLEHCRPNSFKKGIIVNALSPYPYLFWLSVGAPITIKAMGHSIFAAAAFIGSFYVLLVGSKISLALLVGRFRSFLTGSLYIYTMRLLGLTLIVFALFLLRDGLGLIGILDRVWF